MIYLSKDVMFNTVEYRIHPTVNVSDGAMISIVVILFLICVTIGIIKYMKLCAEVNSKDDRQDKKVVFPTC